MALFNVLKNKVLTEINKTFLNSAHISAEKESNNYNDEINNSPENLCSNASFQKENNEFIPKSKKEIEADLPQDLSLHIPDNDMIVISAYSNGSSLYGKYFYTGLLDKYVPNAQDSFVRYEIQYRGLKDYRCCTEEVFSTSYHPFISCFTENVSNCSKHLVNYFGFKPSSFKVSKHKLLVDFDSGYYDAGYEETPNYIRYAERYQESYHDGGGNGYEEWYLYANNEKKIPQNLLNEKYINGVFIPECKGYWLNNGHLNLVDPWGIPGVFEFYYYALCRPCAEEEEKSEAVGVKPWPWI